MATDFERVTEVLSAINQAWLEGRPHQMEPLIHPDITMVFPGFAGRITGRDAFVGGFVDFCRIARVVSFQEFDRQVDRIADLAVASFGYEMTYERDGARWQASGRDLWVFARHAESWLACWRTMLELHEQPASDQT